MDHFAGLDVSVKETSVCIVDDTGRIVREVKVTRKKRSADLAAYIRRHHTEEEEVEAWLGKFLSKGVSQPTGQLLMTLNEAISESFSYRRRSARGTQTPSETLRRQNGTCRT